MTTLYSVFCGELTGVSNSFLELKGVVIFNPKKSESNTDMMGHLFWKIISGQDTWAYSRLISFRIPTMILSIKRIRFCSSYTAELIAIDPNTQKSIWK